MRSRLLQLGLAAAIALSVIITVAVALEWWTVAAGAGAVLVSAVLVTAADANRQVRMVRRQLRKTRHGDAARPEDSTTVPLDSQIPIQESRADMLGAVRVLQAQYTARMDRLQAALDEAVEELRRENDQGAGDRAPR